MSSLLHPVPGEQHGDGGQAGAACDQQDVQRVSADDQLLLAAATGPTLLNARHMRTGLHPGAAQQQAQEIFRIGVIQALHLFDLVLQRDQMLYLLLPDDLLPADDTQLLGTK